MTYEQYRSAVLDVSYLASCALNGAVPEAERVRLIDTSVLYETASRHLLTGITAMALESAGINDEAFTQAKGKAIRKVAYFDVERSAVLEALENAGIWHMPLKGAVIKDLYPAIGMREMADNDILYDGSRRDDVIEIMKSLGFAYESKTTLMADEHFYKPPVCNFEMHNRLFDEGMNSRFIEYYQDVKNRLILDTSTSFRYHFSDNDFYIYMIAHEYKHYSNRGTGLRSLLDTYVYLTCKKDMLDRDYISAELEKLGIADFEKRNSSLSLNLFGGMEFTPFDNEMLDYIVSSGTYGTIGNMVKNTMSQYGNKPFKRLRYVFSRVFLPMSKVKASYPFFAKHKILLPLLPFYRLIRGLTDSSGRKRITTELRSVLIRSTRSK